MKITVHRGARQIGGCATEIATEKTRVLIDFGSELPQPGQETAPLSVEGVTSGPPRCGGVFFTHYHGDHVGEIGAILPDIPLYMDAAGREILLTLQRRLALRDPQIAPLLPRLEAIRPLTQGVPVTVGDLRVTPFTVDHSAYNSCMFLIEGEGQKILHTGDFRAHGFRGKGLWKVLKTYVGQVDLLITEGTVLSREDGPTVTERDLSLRARDYLRQYKNVFVLCASTNIDRLAGLHAAARAVGKPFLCDGYQAQVLRIAAKYGGPKSPLYRLRPLVYGKNLLPLMEERGFCMPVRQSERFRRLMTRFDPAETILLYSMWRGYLDQNPALADFLNPWRWEYFHTSGHAARDQLRAVIQTVRPRLGVAVLHTQAPHALAELCPPYPFLPLKDGQVLEWSE